MPAATPLLALPYPVAADPADVPHDVQALANKLDTRPANIVAALPGAPIDGQTIDYQADATNGVVWRLRYRAGSPSAYKWEFVGGAPLWSEVIPNEALATVDGAYHDLTTVGPQVAVPLAGDYMLNYGATINPNGAANGFAIVSVAIGATEAVGADSIVAQIATGAFFIAMSRGLRKTAVPAAANLKLRYQAGVGSASFQRRWLSVAPVRVG